MASGSGAERPLSTPTEVLEALTYLLGFPSDNSGLSQRGIHEEWAQLPWENIPHHSAPQPSGESTAEEPEEMSNGCDFSSFPSLSLQKKKTGENSDSENFFHHKEGIEAHVASLLSRPILVSNDQEKQCETDDEDDEDEVSEFVEDRVARVPHLMQQNLVLSFSTLVQSRIRAYSSFLARHGLSLAAATSEPSQKPEDGVVGVEQKLETLVELGNLVALGDVHTSFLGRSTEANVKSDGEEQRASMPLNLKATISVLIPTLDGKPECLTMHLHTSGNVTGIFTKDPSNPLLRVVQVDLDMPQLLRSMKKAAAATVSRVVEITNATYSVPLPRVLSTDLAAAAATDHQLKGKPSLSETTKSITKKRPHLIEDDYSIITPSCNLESKCASNPPGDLDLVELEDLSADKCGKIVDSLFDKIDVRVLSPPGKRVRFSPTDDVDAIALTLPIV